MPGEEEKERMKMNKIKFLCLVYSILLKLIQGCRKMICFRGAENNNLTLIMFTPLKVNFNQGGCKWAEPERACWMAGKCIKCLPKMQAKFNIQPSMDD